MTLAQAETRAEKVPGRPLALRTLCCFGTCPNLHNVARGLGLSPGTASQRRWFDTIDELARTLPRLIRPRGIFRIDRVARLQARVLELESGVVFRGAVGRFLQHAELVATFVVTIGSAVERLSRGWLRAGKIVRGVVANTIASEAVESAADRLQDDVRTWALGRGFEITPRYSPGYCGMDVQQQIPLFASLPTHRINVRLTPSCLMLPVKSVSGLIGIGPVAQVGPADYPCRFCDHPTCMQRRAAFQG
jgi:hypothetical protein